RSPKPHQASRPYFTTLFGSPRGNVSPVGADPGYTAHDSAVATLRDSFTGLAGNTSVSLGKRTSNLFRFPSHQGQRRLDVSALDHVLAVDPDARTADVEGMVTYEKLVDATLPYGLMPLVVPQLKTITLGGAVAGLGIESSSFRNGLPHESVLEMEVLTGDARLLTVDADGEHSALFHGFPNSHGSLGSALRLRIGLQPVLPFVRLTHERYGTAAELADRMTQVCDTREADGEQVDFVDGTVFGPDEQYLTLGTFVDAA